MRTYYFNNMYLAGIHNGIQAGHAKDEMWAAVTDHRGDPKFDVVRDFAKNHKTFVILMGGDHKFLQDTYLNLFCRKDNPHPHAWFKEPGLNDAVTSLAIIIPDRLYDDTANDFGRALVKNGGFTPGWNKSLPDTLVAEITLRNYTPWEIDFLMFKSPCPLAK